MAGGVSVGRLIPVSPETVVYKLNTRFTRFLYTHTHTHTHTPTHTHSHTHTHTHTHTTRAPCQVRNHSLVAVNVAPIVLNAEALSALRLLYDSSFLSSSAYSE